MACIKRIFNFVQFRHRDETTYSLLQAGADYLKKDPYGWTSYEQAKDSDLYAKPIEIRNTGINEANPISFLSNLWRF